MHVRLRVRIKLLFLALILHRRGQKRDGTEGSVPRKKASLRWIKVIYGRIYGPVEKRGVQPGKEAKGKGEGEQQDEETNRAVYFLGPAFVDAVAGAVPAVDVVPSVSPRIQGRVTSDIQGCPPRAATSGSLVFRRLSLQIFEDVRSPANA